MDNNSNRNAVTKKRCSVAFSLPNASEPISGGSAASEGSERQKQQPQGVNKNYQLVEEIIDGIFYEKTGVVEVSSSSSFSIEDNQDAEPSGDPHLRHWDETLRRRELIGRRIKKKTGKKQNELLFTANTAAAEKREKQKQKQMMEYAEHMSPSRLTNRKRLVLHRYENTTSSERVKELQPPLPKTGRRKKKSVAELVCESKSQDSTNSTKEVRRNGKKREGKHYPSMDNLEVVGKSLKSIIRKNRNASNIEKHDSKIELVAEVPILQISSNTSFSVVGRKDIT